jgi:hypothetical protein
MQYWKMVKEIGSSNDKWAEIIAVKCEILENLLKSLNLVASRILFLQFNPIALNLGEKYDITIVCDSSLKEVYDCDDVTIISDLSQASGKFDIVFGLDEYFTHAKSEIEQRSLIDNVAAITQGWLITTLQDYKNFAPHKKNQIDALTFSGTNNYIVLESCLPDKTDRQVWDHYWYVIKNHNDLTTIGPVKRRTMYFKQIAKYAADAGSKQFVVQKNLLYKGFFSKVFEHIITVKF